MTPELLNLYQELGKITAYFIGYPNDPKLHPIVIDKPTINNIYEFGVSPMRRHLLLNSFRPENMPPTLPETELLLYQLSVKQYHGKKP